MSRGRKKMELNLKNVIIDLHFNAGLSYNYLTRLFALNIKACKSTIYNICREYKQNKLNDVKLNLKPNNSLINNDLMETNINLTNEIINNSMENNIKIISNENISNNKNTLNKETFNEETIINNEVIENDKVTSVINLKNIVSKENSIENNSIDNDFIQEEIKEETQKSIQYVTKYDRRHKFYYQGKDLVYINLNKLTSKQKNHVLNYIKEDYLEYQYISSIDQINNKQLVIYTFYCLYEDDYQQLASAVLAADKFIKPGQLLPNSNLKEIDIANLNQQCIDDFIKYFRKTNSPYKGHLFQDIPKKVISTVFKELYPEEYNFLGNEYKESDKYPHVDFYTLNSLQQTAIRAKAAAEDSYTYVGILPQDEINRIYYELQKANEERKEKEKLEQEKLKQRKEKEAIIKEKIPSWYNEDHYIKGISVNDMKTYLAFFILYKNEQLPNEDTLESMVQQILNHDKLQSYSVLSHVKFIKLLKNSCDDIKFQVTNIVNWLPISYIWDDL